MESVLFALAHGSRQTLCDQLVEQINGIVLSDGFEHVGESHQGGDTAFRQHARDGLRPSRRGITRQGYHAPPWDAGEVELAHFQSPYFRQPGQRLDQRGRTDARGRAAEPIERGKACPSGHGQQCFQPLPLFRCRQLCQRAPQPRCGAIAYPPAVPWSDRTARSVFRRSARRECTASAAGGSARVDP
jgi:hypothetical protein